MKFTLLALSYFAISLLCDSQPKIKNTNKIVLTSNKVNTNWIGTWRFEDTGVEYVLKIDEKYRGMNLCKYTAIGIQTWYELECQGYDKGDSFELYFRSVNDGSFMIADKINLNKPALTLKLRNGKVITYWNQLFNNYEGNHSGRVCFRKVNQK
ncbi:DUF5991 domain-containing protein [Spirosoma fluviale]|uniref:Uncharacterized protein n=1 Tax=Spirosoma fluviale TaxID=1597977 RepID=A0A286GW41_9BACT|nr:DUF5991 domain-containing protein [Spirosoma fluviale]SOD99777.1 hypothetical protein SAMN06269250_0158 [Spirosoma fluviale]